jgi:signal transduction histidine kinase/putative methionine-R-sulfoxide reductase with GAF domain
MTDQAEQVSDLAALLDRHQEEIASLWAEKVQRLPDAHYRELPWKEIRTSTARGLRAICEALVTKSYTPLESYLTDVCLTRLQMGFSIGEVIRALLLCKDAALPVIWREYPSDPASTKEAIVQLDACLRSAVGRFGELYAEEAGRNLRKQQKQTTLMLETAQAASGSLELDEVLQRVAKSIAAALGVPHCGIYLVNQGTGVLIPTKVRTAPDTPNPSADDLLYSQGLDPAHDAFVREIFENRRPVICPHAETDPLTNKEIVQRLGLKSLLGVPFVVKDRVVAVAEVASREVHHTVTEEQIELAWGIANAAAMAIENARLYVKTQQHADEAELLFSVQQAITGELDLNAVLQMIADEARRLTSTDQGAVYLLDGNELVVSVISGKVDSDMLGYRLPVEGSVAGLAVQTGKPFLVPDAQDDPRVHADIIRHVGAGSFVIVPLLAGSRAIGTITVASERPGMLGSEDERVLTMMASGAVIALENARLYKEEQERRQIAEGLREILAVLNSNRPLEEILDFIVAQVVPLLGANAGVIYRLDSNEQKIIIESASGMPDEFIAIGPIPLTDTKPNRATLNRQPYAVTDLEAAFATYSASSSSLPPQIKAWIVAVRAHFGSYLSVPLIVSDMVYGAVSIFYHKPREFSDEEIKLAVAFSDQAALAIENARLHQAEQNRQRELQTLLDVAAAASSSLELDEMLSAVLNQLVTLVGALRAGVMLLNSESGELESRMIRPEQSIAPEDLAKMCQVCSDVIASGKPLYVPVDAALGYSEPGALLPLLVRGQAVGVLVIIGPQGSAFSEGYLALFESIADQLGVAVENARLYERVEQAAIAAERSRLARDLHDSVTQSLYSMTLFAEAARRLIASKDQESVEEYLSQLCETSQQALKEMRLLVYELRPSTLEEEGLVGVLRQRLDTVEKRAGVEAQLSAEGQLDLPKKIEEGLYRIAQEALNNSLKHAAATAVTVRIQIEGNLLTMEITDDGRGFEVDAAADTGGIGLSSMQERAEKLNGDLRIVSTPGKGTKVQVRVKVR